MTLTDGAPAVPADPGHKTRTLKGPWGVAYPYFRDHSLNRKLDPSPRLREGSAALKSLGSILCTIKGKGIPTRSCLARRFQETLGGNGFCLQGPGPFWGPFTVLQSLGTQSEAVLRMGG